jgi:cation transport regulator ChaC
LTLHFAYGSNMSRPLMQARCRDAQALGIASLAGWRFVINPDGFGSIALQSGGRVHGVLWRLTTRDLAAINAYEGIDAGLYLRRMLPVRHGSRQTRALVYIARRGGEGTPRPGYVATVVEAARYWRLPEAHVRSLLRWSPSGWCGVRARDTGEVG